MIGRRAAKKNNPGKTLSPADVDAAVPTEQDVGDGPAAPLQGVLDVSARRLGANVLRRGGGGGGGVSGEANLEVAERATGHEALQLLSANTEFSGKITNRRNFPRQGCRRFHKERAPPFIEASVRGADGDDGKANGCDKVPTTPPPREQEAF